MPIYEFRCKVCGRVTTRLERGQGTCVVCAHCGGNDLEKLISRVAILKGETEFAARFTRPDVLRAMGRASAGDLARWVDGIEAELGGELRGDIERMASQVEAVRS